MEPIDKGVIIAEGSTEVISTGSTVSLLTNTALREYYYRKCKGVIRILVEIGIIISNGGIRHCAVGKYPVGILFVFCILGVILVAD